MKWAFTIQRKIRLAVMLAIMMLFIIIFNLIETYNITRISRSFNSIYEDRLIPAVDLYSVADHIHNKRHQLFTFLYTENISPKQINLLLQKSNTDLDQLISKYEHTHLVKDETNHLARLKKNLEYFQRDELMVIAAAEHNREAAKKMYINNIMPLYDELNEDLVQLTLVQTRVGKELLEESISSKTSSTLISQLQVAITIILGLIIMILIIANKQVLLKQEKYTLN
jgi:hypothetical protein